MTYSATLSNGNPLPVWFSFDPLTRTFTGTPAEVSNLSLKVTAKDSANISVSCPFSLEIVTGIKNDEGIIPESSVLYQNFPNPFNPTTVIEFEVAKTARFTLSVFNILGERIKIISDKEYTAGHYKETFNSTGLSSGIYIYQLTGKNVNIIRKMALLR